MSTADIQSQLDAAQAALADAQAEYETLAGELADAQAKIHTLEANVTALKAQLAASQRTRIFLWPFGPDAATLRSLETKLGVHFDGGRPRGGFGQYLGPVDTAKKIAHANDVQGLIKKGFPIVDPPRTFADFTYSTNLDPRVGTLQNRYPPLWADIAAGSCDQGLIRELRTCKAYPGIVQCEWGSEYNVRQPAPSAQPWPPDGEVNANKALAHFRALRDQVGASNVLIGVSLAGHVWGKGGYADKYLTPMLAANLLDFVAADAYNHAGQRQQPAAMFTPFIEWWHATAPKVKAAITENGNGEPSWDMTYHTSMLAFLKQVPDLYSITMTHGDHNTGPYLLDRTPACAQAAAALVKGLQGA